MIYGTRNFECESRNMRFISENIFFCHDLPTHTFLWTENWPQYHWLKLPLKSIVIYYTIQKVIFLVYCLFSNVLIFIANAYILENCREIHWTVTCCHIKLKNVVSRNTWNNGFVHHPQCKLWWRVSSFIKIHQWTHWKIPIR